MSGDGKFWVSIWSVVGITFIAFTALCSNHYTKYNEQVVEALKAGVPPIEVLCALDDSKGNNPTCMMIAAKQEK